MTVGHIEQTAMAKSAAGSDFWKSTSPSGSHARGDRTQHLHDGVEHPGERGRNTQQESDRRRDGDSKQETLSDAHQTVVGEQQDSLIGFTALVSGSRMYSLLSSHVRTGDGRSDTRRDWRSTRHQSPGRCRRTEED